MVEQTADDTTADLCDPMSRSLYPARAVAEVTRGRTVFALAILSYAAIDFWLLRWLPVSETGDFWHIFYTSYSELFFRGDLAHWFPYGSYGQPNDLYNLMELSSADYLMMLIGKLFQIRNAVLLYQLSLILDHLIFLFGIYLLSRQLFRRKSSVLFSVIGSIAFLHGFNLEFIEVFRTVSWLPVIVYFVVLFFRDSGADNLWIAGVLFVFWCLGAVYIPPHLALCLLSFVAVATWHHPAAWRSVCSLRPRNIITMTIFVLAALLYLYTVRQTLIGIDVVRAGRSSSGAVSVESFLGNRHHTIFEMFISMSSGGIFYIGLLPLVCVAWGVFHARSASFGAFMCSAALLGWFGLGGLFSLSLFCCVPLFAWTRYLYFAFYVMRLPLLLAAAAAWDELSPSFPKDLKGFLIVAVVVVLLLDLSLYGDGFVLAGSNANVFVRLWRPTYVRLAVYAAFVALAAIVSRASGRTHGLPQKPWQRNVSLHALITAALLAALFVDVFQYSYRSGLPVNQYAYNYREPPIVGWNPADRSQSAYQAARVRPLRWQAERIDEPLDAQQRVILASPTYFHTYGYAHFDPCESALLVRGVAPSMGKLLALRDKGDHALQAILGCHAPKMRLVSNALYVKDEVEAEKTIRTTPDLAALAILAVPEGDSRPPQSASASAGDPGFVSVSEFGTNALTVKTQVANPEGAWLIYADAYDPRWRAWVNDQPTPVVPAYIGLKAVRVPRGDAVVRMAFVGPANVAMSALALGGAICSLSLLVYCAICCIRGFPTSRRWEVLAP